MSRKEEEEGRESKEGRRGGAKGEEEHTGRAEVEDRGMEERE